MVIAILALEGGKPWPAFGDDKTLLKDQGGFAVVELFTSQGCSSCPPADANLAELTAEAQQNNLPVYTLSFHVDYWNKLGWTDPFSNPRHSKRQREYARRFRARRIYTPQMVINGNAEFVGSNRVLTRKVVNFALTQQPASELAIFAKQSEHKVAVTWKGGGIVPNHRLIVALVQNRAEQQVTRGENAGKRLAHVNVVRDFRELESPGLTGVVEFSSPRGSADGFHVIAYVQSPQSGLIVAAARATP